MKEGGCIYGMPINKEVLHRKRVDDDGFSGQLADLRLLDLIKQAKGVDTNVDVS